MQGLLGKKLGMTQVYDQEGRHIPVTVIGLGPCVVVQRKVAARDGYEAVQLGFLDQKEQRVNKPLLGHFKKAGASAKRVLREFRVGADETAKEGDTLTAEVFEGVTYVDVSGVTKGRGFQGVVKRHGMGGGPAAHGHTSHRRPGSIGMRTQPGRIFKNKRLPGHMGHVNITVQNLRVVQVRKDDNAILVEGAVPGPTGSILVVKKAIKKG
ncbi:MAG TPA: 50S ribosomal protein L3 [Kiritimatiellia bacterium]|nr:50S ribosomal protein L3 [Kiritimatiellia bacterium]HMO98821.1 50S ribosomal protein L3 [Kiritimatiellia bacterium]HMP96231.1 50S ribosomal protein L3 [Kiritimatiellia bacterium]